jgi:hypothetical protein
MVEVVIGNDGTSAIAGLLTLDLSSSRDINVKSLGIEQTVPYTAISLH